MVASKDDDLKTVNFFYYRLMTERKDKKGHIKPMVFDLSEWSTEVMNGLTVEEKNFEYGGDTIRLQTQYIDSNNNLLCLRFNRLSAEQVPFIANFKDDEEKEVELAPDEYIANDVSCIFDTQNGILMLQRNIRSLSVHAISDYINYFWNIDKEEEEKELILFEPVVSPDVFTQAKRGGNKYQNLLVKTANKYSEVKKNGNYRTNVLGGLIEKTINDLKPTGNLNIELNLDSGRSKENYLDKNSVIEILNSIESHPTAFSKAALKYVNEFNVVETLNLLNALVSDSFQFNNPPKSHLNYDRVIAEMQRFYLPNKNNVNGSRRTYINNIIAKTN